ncbi:cytochrome P450 [Mycena albidolilacea]|uniref:Cytochrome P450 n=1 Tax=Mycena albidolilacea TaxID=1033008 RepID=A0AAD7AVR7_9AGAR|nr:cytochrome P450 [Mycena albidolilacea]
MIKPTPGVSYLLELLPSTLIPPIATYVFLSHILPRLNLGVPLLPLWSQLLAALLAHPVLTILAHFYMTFRNARDAAARGAGPIPEAYDKWPGGWSLMTALAKTEYPGDFLLDWFETYGNTFKATVAFDPVIFTIEPDHIKAILATEFDHFWKDPLIITTGVFNADDDMWKFHRSMSRPFFHRERISDFDTFDTHTRDALAHLKKRLADGYPVDIQDCVSRFTLDSATEFLFGKSVDSMSAGLSYPESSPLSNAPSFLSHPSNTYVRAFTYGQLMTVKRGALATKWPLAELWADKVKPHRDIADAYIEPILDAALERKRANEKDKDLEGGKGDEEATFLSHLVQATDNKEVIKDSIFNILVAGRDTTAATLTFAVYMLAEHPEIAVRLRKEILDTVGSSRMITYDDLRSMKYLRAFLNGAVLRTSRKATTLPAIRPGDKPFYVTPNTKVRYSVFLMHRRKDLWGPDALKFDPDRFLDERVKKYLTPNPFIFLPFNAGPRICLGQQFALNEASFFLVRLLQNFTGFALAPDAQPGATRPPAHWKNAKGTQATEKIMLGRHLTMFAKGGLWVRMEEVKSE